MLALDLCDTHLVTPEWVAAVKADGCRMVILNAWFGNRSAPDVERALRYIREGGLITAVYYVPHAFRPAAYHLQRVREAVGDEWEHLGEGLAPDKACVWIDVEKVSKDPPRAQWNGPHLETSRRLVVEAGKVPGIYTNGSAWNAGGPEWLGATCSDLALWVADYNGDPTIDLRYPFGGWAAADAKQYLGTTDVHGINCDLSTFPDAWLAVQASQAGQEAALGPSPDEVAVLHARWAEAASLRAQADAIEAEVIAEKVRLGLQPA